MSQSLANARIAILATNGFEQVELTEPRKALQQAGAKTDVVSPQSGEIKGWQLTDWGEKVKVDKQLSSARPEDYDALLLPGGVMSPDKLRMDPEAVSFVKRFFESGKPVAAICHGPWTLVEAGVVQGLKMTSWPSLKTDLKNAGANWVDETVVTDRNLTTSRNPDDIPAFNQRIIEQFSAGMQMPRKSA